MKIHFPYTAKSHRTFSFRMIAKRIRSCVYGAAGMLVCAGLLQFNCCVSCTNMNISTVCNIHASTFQLTASSSILPHLLKIQLGTTLIRPNEQMETSTACGVRGRETPCHRVCACAMMSYVVNQVGLSAVAHVCNCICL